MKKRIIYLIFLAVIAFSLLLSAEKTFDEKIADLEKKLPAVSGKKKVALLNQISWNYTHKSADLCIRYARQASVLAQQLKYPQGEANAYKNIAVGSCILGDLEKGREYFQKALQIFVQIKNRAGESKILNNMGIVYGRSGDYDKALELLQQALELAKEIGTKEGIAKALLNIGNVYRQISRYDKALDYHLQALKINEESGNKHATSGSLQNIGNIYMNLGKPKQALVYFQKSLMISEELGDKYGLCNNFICMGVTFQGLKNYPRALEYFQKALPIAEELGDKRGTARTLASIGLVYRNLPDHKRALEYFQKALVINKEINDIRQTASTLIDIGDSYTILKDYEKARENLEQAIKIGKKLKVKDLLKMSYDKLSQLYAARRDYEKALEYYQLFHYTDQEILNQNSHRQINELQEKYKAAKRAKEIEDLKKNNEIQQLKLAKERMTRNTFIVSFILVLFILGLVFKKYLYLFAFWKKQKYIGQFRLMEKISSGATGTVYKAYNIHDKSMITAVKILKEELFGDEVSIKRFKREAALIDKLEHPNIIRVFQRGESQQSLFIAMEYLEGKTLGTKITEEGQLTIKESLHIMRQISDALAFIHGKNIIHRDIKPDNIMLIEKDGDPNFVKLLDFGLARMEFETRLTQSGIFLGTLQYMAPEQVLKTDSSTSNDIFSMGVMFYRMLCRQNPFGGETFIAIIRELIDKNPPEVSQLRPDVPKELNELVKKMMNKNPGQRPSAASIRDVLFSIASFY
ncbi:MAG: tetratricopeptide repeat protein [Candidatus Aminicenantes bacterium]|jgi:tetratricopeptide (TPR) repeat protein